MTILLRRSAGRPHVAIELWAAAEGGTTVGHREWVAPADPPVDVFAALADPMRWRLLALLADHEHSASALARELPISRPGVLKHLAVLERGELVHKHRAGWDRRLDALKRLAEGDD